MMIQFGERIELKEFKEHMEPGEITILKKMIGNRANHLGNFKKLTLHLKEVHRKEKTEKFQINANIVSEKNNQYEAETTNYNLFFAINDVLTDLKEQVEREK